MRAAALAALLAASLQAAGIEDRIGALVDAAPAAVRGSIGVHVVDAATGTPIYERNEHQLFLPASNLKLFTAALALARLGPDYRFQTRLLQDAAGSLVLVGAGDPSLSSRVYPYSASAKPLPSQHAIEELVDLAVAAGLRRVDGDIVGDDQRYPWSPYPESWTADDAQHEFGAPVSALTFSDNTVTISVRPGTRTGALATIELDPGFEYFTIDNRVITTDAAGGTVIRVARIPGTRQVVVSGVITSRSGAVREVVAVDDPALFTAYALYNALLRRGIPVRGRPVARHRVAQILAPTEGRVLATRTSPPLSELLQATIKVSQNLHAEMYLREVGAAKQGQGTVANGLRELRVLLTELRIPAADVVSEDASGLARNDEVTPRAFTQLLVAMDRSEQRELWRSLFPVGGQDGTLSARLCCASEPVSIRAKTGTLSRAIALSGYADSKSSGRLAFSILVNNFAASAAEVRAWVDRLAMVLVE